MSGRLPAWPRRSGVAAGLVAVALVLAAGSAQAHTETAVGGGFVRGLLHPLAGGDHLLAMVAVGMWGAVLGAPLVWLLPVTFPLLMVIGAVAALAGLVLPANEVGIAASVVVLGGAIAAAWRAPVPAALAVVALFGFLHGFAHGRELPAAASPAAYAIGFVLASGLLHGAGILIGTIRSVPRGALLLRLVGGGIAVFGLWLLAGRSAQAVLAQLSSGAGALAARLQGALDGAAFLLQSALALAAVLATCLALGCRPGRTALPAALLFTAAALALVWLPPPWPAEALAPAVLLLLGAAVAAGRPPQGLLAGVAVLLGGLAAGSAGGLPTATADEAAGSAAVLFGLVLGLTVLAGLAPPAPRWARGLGLARRMAGAWIAAVGILMLALWLRGGGA